MQSQPARERAMIMPALLKPGKPLLLVVDDQPGNILALYEIFNGDYEVCMAASGADAIALCQARQPDLILLDVVMPGMGGFAVCRQLKDNPMTRDIPVIFITGKNNPLDEARGLDAGGVDFITKPYHEKVVRARVRTHLTLKHQADLLRSMALLDSLTGIANRRQFDLSFDLEWRCSLRSHKPIALIFVDVDYFKLYNDHYGHPAGDVCLQSIARVLTAGLTRAHDMVARYGGEEFICILPDTPFIGAQKLAEELEASVRALAMPHEKSDAAAVVTISLGVAVATPVLGASASDLLACADTQLYLAKRSGRAQVCAQQTG